MQKNRDQVSLAMPFSRGIAWLLQSLSLMRLQSGRLLLIAVIMQLILGLTQVPLIGLLVIISVPGLSAGILEAFDVTRRGGHPGLNLLFKPLLSGAHTGRLLMMGALIFVVGVLSISLLLSGSEELLNSDLLSRIEQGDVDAISQLDQEALSKMVIAFLIGISISGTLSYFTIPLIWFRNRKLGAALLEGIRALVTHWRAFVMLALGLFAALIPVAVVTGFLFQLASGSGLLSVIVMGGIMVLLLAFQMLLFGTQYCAFRDIFGIDSPTGPPIGDDDSQLVA
jgi:hypothetical protein